MIAHRIFIYNLNLTQQLNCNIYILAHAPATPYILKGSWGDRACKDIW